MRDWETPNLEGISRAVAKSSDRDAHSRRESLLRRRLGETAA